MNCDKPPLKITYTDGDHKLNFYIWNPYTYYEGLEHELDYHLFEKRELPKCELRIYWIDEDSDQIDVLSGDDYKVFQSKCGAKDRLYVAPKAVKMEGNPADCVMHEKKAEHADVSSEQPKTNGQPTTKQ